MSHAVSLDLDITKRYAHAKFVLQARLSINQPGVTALFGDSGSGKTTLLRAIAGLDKEVTGQIVFKDQIWLAAGTRMAPHKRPIGYVFQDAYLFEHLTVAENLQFAIKRAPTRTEPQNYANILSLLKLQNLLNQYPRQLSGGESQRVALARSLLIQPELLLLDEPLSALDEKLKQDIMPYLETLCRNTHLPIIYVTHSIDEVCRLADNVCIMEQGKLIAQGSTAQMLDKLNSYDQQQHTSALISNVIDHQDTDWGLSGINIDGQRILFKTQEHKLGDNVRLRLAAKDVSISLNTDSRSSILNQLYVRLNRIEEHPIDKACLVLTLELGSHTLYALITRFSAHQLSLTTGMTVIAQIKSVAVIR